LQWAGNDLKVVKPEGLLSDTSEAYAGCVEPVLERSFCNLLGIKAWDNLKLLRSSISQLKYLSSLKRAEHSTEIEKLFNAFVELLKRFPVEGAAVYKELSGDWIYCSENGKARFLNKDSLAMNVANPVFPELFALPWIYRNDNAATKFFKRWVWF